MMSRVAMSVSRSLIVSRATWTTASVAPRFYSAHKKPYSDKMSQIRDFRQSDREYGAVKPRVPNKADKVQEQEGDGEPEFDFDPKSPEFRNFIESLTPEERQEVLKDIEELNEEPESPFNKTKDFDLLRHYSAERKPHFRPEKFYGEEHASLVAGDREPTPSEREAASKFEVKYGKVSGFIDHGRFTVGTILRVRSHTNVTAGGRVNSYSAITVVGDQKGTVGIGYGKSPIYSQCEPNAHSDALKKLVAFDVVKGSVSHPIKYKYKSTTIYLWPRPPGYGIVASPLAFTIFSAAGITDITCKVHGSRNVLNVARGIVEALKYSEDPRTTALKLGVKYEDKSALYSPYGQTSYY